MHLAYFVFTANFSVFENTVHFIKCYKNQLETHDHPAKNCWNKQQAAFVIINELNCGD